LAAIESSPGYPKTESQIDNSANFPLKREEETIYTLVAERSVQFLPD
jgi:hypothetical protein